MKTFLKIFFLVILLLPASADELVLKGSVEKTIPSGTHVKLKIVSLPMPEQSFFAENWDLEGEFIPPKEGDSIVSELAEPIFIEKDLILPKGTKFYGKVSRVIPPKRFGRDGSIQVSFDGLQTPKGKTLKFQEAALSQPKKDFTKGQNIARSATRLSSFAAGGAVAGALIVTQAGGLLLTAVQPQYLLASGAGVGLLIGTVAAIVKKGKPGRLMPGDEISINLEQSLVLPVAEPVQELKPQKTIISGLNIQILGKHLLKDELNSFNFVLDLEIRNNTNKTFSGSDFLLLGPYNRQIMPGGLSLDFKVKDNNNLFSSNLKPGSFLKGQIAFEIDFPGFEHILVLKEHFSQQIIYQEPIGFPKDYLKADKMTNFKKQLFGEGSNPWE